MRRLIFAALLLSAELAFGAKATHPSPTSAPTPAPEIGRRITSLFLSQTFLNEQLAAHVKPDGMFRDLKLELDPIHAQLYLRGLLQVPVEELRAINLDPKLGEFRFQVTLKPETTPEGYLILEFPLGETYFYPASSKDRAADRIVVPTQMLSLALASARGYLAAVSGDFTGFDRRTAKLNALIKALDKSIANEKNEDALDEMKTRRESLRLQLAAVPLERKQLKNVSKEVESLLGFTGEKELNLNDELAARKNALIVKLNLNKLLPYLKGIQLGGVRIVRDKKAGENYLSVDVNADMSVMQPALVLIETPDGKGPKTAPSAIIKLNQTLLETEMIVSAEKKAMGSQLSDLKIELKADGLHIGGNYHKLGLTVPFDTTVEIQTTGVDVFEIRIKEFEIDGIDVEFLNGFILDSLKKRLDQSLKNICSFREKGTNSEHNRALEVTVDPKALIPALPGFHLVDVDVSDREFLLKIGR